MSTKHTRNQQRGAGTTDQCDSMRQINTSKPSRLLQQQLQLHLTGDRYRERSYIRRWPTCFGQVGSGCGLLPIANMFPSHKNQIYNCSCQLFSCLCCCCCCCSYCLGYLLHMRRLFASRYPYPPCHGNLSSNCRHSANNLTLMHVEFNCFMYESTRTVFPMLAPGPTQRVATLHMAV